MMKIEYHDEFPKPDHRAPHSVLVVGRIIGDQVAVGPPGARAGRTGTERDLGNSRTAFCGGLLRHQQKGGGSETLYQEAGPAASHPTLEPVLHRNPIYYLFG